MEAILTEESSGMNAGNDRLQNTAETLAGIAEDQFARQEGTLVARFMGVLADCDKRYNTCLRALREVDQLLMCEGYKRDTPHRKAIAFALKYVSGE